MKAKNLKTMLLRLTTSKKGRKTHKAEIIFRSVIKAYLKSRNQSSQKMVSLKSFSPTKITKESKSLIETVATNRPKTSSSSIFPKQHYWSQFSWMHVENKSSKIYFKKYQMSRLQIIQPYINDYRFQERKLVNRYISTRCYHCFKYFQCHCETHFWNAKNNLVPGLMLSWKLWWTDVIKFFKNT